MRARMQIAGTNEGENNKKRESVDRIKRGRESTKENSIVEFRMQPMKKGKRNYDKVVT